MSSQWVFPKLWHRKICQIVFFGRYDIRRLSSCLKDAQLLISQWNQKYVWLKRVTCMVGFELHTFQRHIFPNIFPLELITFLDRSNTNFCMLLSKSEARLTPPPLSSLLVILFFTLLLSWILTLVEQGLAHVAQLTLFHLTILLSMSSPPTSFKYLSSINPALPLTFSQNSGESFQLSVPSHEQSG